MTTISEDLDVCTVIVTVDADAAFLPRMVEHAYAGLEAFPSFAGFLSGALHVSDDGGRLVQYLQWRTEADHEACVADTMWEALPSTARFLELVESGRAKMDVRTYSVRRTVR